ncbi:M4 family metallopeptidase [Sphingomonas sp. PAMC 26605]|uniref:M4 family metallopeptidase n=1 Tax=Sphingomonas sp. PAMC 26605 TaxID=1112214 RepID=UPI00026CD177|nr:M4 family metallopeptidase [Sphingomonas sp. PAMC 26605]
MACRCCIIPDDVLLRFASDPDLSDETRQALHHTAALSDQIRALRQQNAALTLAAIQLPIAKGASNAALPQALPAAHIFDCHHTMTLPGAQVANPGSSTTGTIKRAYGESENVAKFYWDIFQRDSIDGNHMTLVSSVHYGVKYNNAFWNGAQMTYGDGDGQIFLDFTRGNDVICHELTHGVTQHSLGLAYSGEAGGLNESMSDVFGSMFRQWEKRQDVHQADWLIGADIMGPLAHKKGFTGLRDMAAPDSAHAMAPQPAHYYPGIGNLDPHSSSGPPNLAFYKAAKAIGGHSWEKAGKIWYRALTTAPATPNMKMAQFAARTRTSAKSLFPDDASIHTAVDNAWTAIGL